MSPTSRRLGFANLAVPIDLRSTADWFVAHVGESIALEQKQRLEDNAEVSEKLPVPGLDGLAHVGGEDSVWTLQAYRRENRTRPLPFAGGGVAMPLIAALEGPPLAPLAKELYDRSAARRAADLRSAAVPFRPVGSAAVYSLPGRFFPLAGERADAELPFLLMGCGFLGLSCGIVRHVARRRP